MLALLTLVTLATLLTPPENISLASPRADRHPSSILSLHNTGHIDSESVQNPEFYTYELQNCENLETTITIHSKAKNFRVKKQICNDDPINLSRSEIINSTNKNDGTLISVENENYFTSDYLNLAKGSNLIKLNYETKKGIQSQLVLKVIFEGQKTLAQ